MVEVEEMVPCQANSNPLWESHAFIHPLKNTPMPCPTCGGAADDRRLVPKRQTERPDARRRRDPA